VKEGTNCANWVGLPAMFFSSKNISCIGVAGYNCYTPFTLFYLLTRRELRTGDDVCYLRLLWELRR